MSDWPFDQPRNVAVITVGAVMRRGAPILLACRTSDDGGWQFLPGTPFEVADGLIVALDEIVLHDPSVLGIADLEPGWQATRASVAAPWVRALSPAEADEG